MFAKLSIVVAASGLAAMVYAVQGSERDFKSLVYRTYRIEHSGREIAVTEERWAFQYKEASGKSHYLLTSTDLATGALLEKNVPVTVTRSGNLERRGTITWQPYRPRIIEREFDTRVDYTKREAGVANVSGRSFLMSFGLRERKYAAEVFRTLKVRADVFENGGAMVRIKCTFIFEIRMIGSCRTEGKEADTETRLIEIKD